MSDRERVSDVDIQGCSLHRQYRLTLRQARRIAQLAVEGRSAGLFAVGLLAPARHGHDAQHA